MSIGKERNLAAVIIWVLALSTLCMPILSYQCTPATILNDKCDTDKEEGTCGEAGDRLREKMISAKRRLAHDGVAVVHGILTPKECDNFVTQLHEWLAKFGPDVFPETKSSIIHAYNVGFHPVAWMTRLKATPIFESLWGTAKLTSSIDGMAIGPPPELNLAKFTDDGRHLMMHLDQGQKKEGLHAYQGAVYLEDAGEDDWCFAVINGSHNYHKEFVNMRNKPLQRREQVVLTDNDIDWYKEKGCHIRKVSVPKGGMVIWDSRTVHAGSKPIKNRKHPDRWRYVVFVCMVPAIWVNADEMAQKKQAYEGLLHTRHWPAQGFQIFNKRSVPAELNAVNELPDIARTEKARLLVGDLVYDFNDGKPNGGRRPNYIADPWTPLYI